MSFTRLGLAMICMAMTATVASAAIEFNDDVTNAAIWGSGNSNGGFTTFRDAATGIELGLRAKVRYPSPSDAPGTGIRIINNNTYGYFAATGHGPGNERGSWNVDWSINSNTNGSGGNLNAYTYTLELDYDPGWGASFQSAYLSSNPINPGVPFYADHSFGNNATAAGAGTEAPFLDAITYGNLVNGNNLAQNSLNWDFYDLANSFDPTVDGRYTVRLSAFDNGNLVGTSEIHVMVGNGVVPEAASLLTWGGIIACVGLARRRRIG